MLDPNKQDDACEFFARVWLTPEDVDHIETWVHELIPVDAMHRSAGDWVQEHLAYYDREWYADEFKLGEGCWQILFKGKLRGYWISCGDCEDYDEEVIIESFEVMQLLPDTWYDFTSDELFLDPEG